MMNFRLALRQMTRAPFVTLVAIASLALGIGANAAIFSLTYTMLLRPLPVVEPERLININGSYPNPGSQSCTNEDSCEYVLSYPMYRDLEAEAPRLGLTAMAAQRVFDANVATKRDAANRDGMLVSGTYFPVLGLHAEVGRLLQPDDDRVVGANYVVVVSYGYWQTHLGGDPNVIGQRLVVNGQSMTIIGVAPRDFDGTAIGTKPAVYVPISMRGVMEPGFDRFTNRRTYWIYAFGRLAPGVTMKAAAQRLNGVYQPTIREVEAPLQKGLSAAQLEKFRAKKLGLEDGRRGRGVARAENRTPLLLLFTMTGLVLLIACANIANLLLARAAARGTEMAVRLSLGAQRRQIIAQLLTESCLLAVLGGLLGLAVARITLAALARMLPQGQAESLDFGLHWGAVLFAAAVSIVTGVLFGLAPALQSARPDLADALRGGSNKLAGGRASARFRTALVVGQIALSMILLGTAGLFAKSLANIAHVDLGFDIDRVVTFSIAPELSGYKPVRAQQLFGDLTRELGAVPGVRSVSYAMIPVLSGSSWGTDVNVQGFQRTPETNNNSRLNEVGPGYLHTLGMTLLSGREFTIADNAGSPQVAIVNETFARQFGLGHAAVGKYMGTNGGDTLNIQIVGLFRDANYNGVKAQKPPMFMTPILQDTTIGRATFYVRTAGDVDQLMRTIRTMVTRHDAMLPIATMKTLVQQAGDNVYLDHMISTLCVAFAVLATLLAAIGLYGVLAYSVAQRTKEIGVRIALGADMGRVRTLVLRQVGVLTIVGCILGVGGAVLVARSARSLLYEMSGADPRILAGAVLVLAAVSVAAGLLPASKAARIDPMEALRQE
jgi:predicted permease